MQHIAGDNQPPTAHFQSSDAHSSVPHPWLRPGCCGKIIGLIRGALSHHASEHLTCCPRLNDATKRRRMMAYHHAMRFRTTKGATVLAKVIFIDLFPLMFVSSKKPMFRQKRICRVYINLYSPIWQQKYNTKNVYCGMNNMLYVTFYCTKQAQ